MTKSLEYYQNDPCAFVCEILGVTSNFAQQDQILLSVRDNPRTAVRAGNGCGKTVTAAEIVLWFTACFRDALVITTSATARQVAQQIWAEIHRHHMNARRPLGGELLTTELRFPKTGSRAIGFTTGDGGCFEGYHSKRILVIVDEAKSVPQEIFDAIERVLSAGGCARLLVISTPGGPTGPFYDIFTKQGHLYSLHHISAYDSPFIRREWIEERKREWGEDSPLFQSAVLGEFPTIAQEGAVIPLAHAQRLLEHPPAPVGTELRAGIDLAASSEGDETVVAVFCGNQQVALEAWRESDTMVTVRKIIDIIARFDVPHGNVNVGADGLGGPVVDRLRELGYTFNPIHNGGEPLNKDRFYNFSAEAWASAAQKIERGEIALLNDQKLVAQLTSRKQKVRTDGRFQLEGKEEMRRRNLPSPDRADAFVLGLALTRRVPELTIWTPEIDQAQRTPEEQLRARYRCLQAEADKQIEAAAQAMHPGAKLEGGFLVLPS